MKKLVSGICMLAIVASLAACSVGGNNGNPFESDTLNVEYGDSVTLPSGDGYSYEVVDEKGAPVKLRYGSFNPEIGTYRVTLTVNGKTYKQTIVVKDTIAPVVQFDTHVMDVQEGDTVEIPRAVPSDKGGIKSRTITVTDGEGQSVTVTDNTFVAVSGKYTVKVTAVDNSGNAAEDTLQVIAHKAYYDETLSAGVAASFNSADYIHKIYLVDGKDCFQSDIKDGNLVLSSDVEYGVVYSTIVMAKENFDFSQAGTVSVRLKTDRATDRLEIIGTENGCIAGSKYYLEANTWYDIEVDPLLLGYGNADSMTILARSNNGVTVTIDEIKYTQNELDANYTGLERFDDESDLARVKQNTYSTRYFLGDKNAIGGGGGSTFSIADKYFYGEEEPVKVLRVETVERNGGFTYLFQRTEDMKNVYSITITLSQEKAMQYYKLGIMYDDYKVSTFEQQVSAGDVDERITITLYAQTDTANNVKGFADKGGSVLTGLWLGTVDGKNAGNVLNIESIEVHYVTQNEEA